MAQKPPPSDGPVADGSTVPTLRPSKSPVQIHATDRNLDRNAIPKRKRDHEPRVWGTATLASPSLAQSERRLDDRRTLGIRQRKLPMWHPMEPKQRRLAFQSISMSTTQIEHLPVASRAAAETPTAAATERSKRFACLIP